MTRPSSTVREPSLPRVRRVLAVPRPLSLSFARALAVTVLVCVQPAAAQTRSAPPAARRGAVTPVHPVAAVAATGSPVSGARDSAAAGPDASIRREVFSYGRGGRRDPFLSLMTSSDLRPLISDLRLVAVVLDPTNRNSVAILRDLSTQDQYRVRVGQTLGRMRVTRIQARSVAFAIEEFGYSRQEDLQMGDSTQARKR